MQMTNKYRVIFISIRRNMHQMNSKSNIDIFPSMKTTDCLVMLIILFSFCIIFVRLTYVKRTKWIYIYVLMIKYSLCISSSYEQFIRDEDETFTVTGIFSPSSLINNIIIVIICNKDPSRTTGNTHIR